MNVPEVYEYGLKVSSKMRDKIAELGVTKMNDMQILRNAIATPTGFDLHYGMFLPTINGQASDEQKDEWLGKVRAPACCTALARRAPTGTHPTRCCPRARYRGAPGRSRRWPTRSWAPTPKPSSVGGGLVARSAIASVAATVCPPLTRSCIEVAVVCRARFARPRHLPPRSRDHCDLRQGVAGVHHPQPDGDVAQVVARVRRGRRDLPLGRRRLTSGRPLLCLEARSPSHSGLGKTCNFVILMARLFLDGKDLGPHPFFVQIRNLKDHSALPGIEVGDIGPKIGFQAVDNGFLRFGSLALAGWCTRGHVFSAPVHLLSPARERWLRAQQRILVSQTISVSRARRC